MAGAPTEARPTCYRCDERVDDTHRIRLSITHGGDLADGFEDVTQRVCPDCVAAMALRVVAIHTGLWNQPRLPREEASNGRAPVAPERLFDGASGHGPETRR